MSALRRWSEDRGVGIALIVAGAVILFVQVIPTGLLGIVMKAWPLALVAVGALLLFGRGNSTRN